jgi:hypothetical protein
MKKKNNKVVPNCVRKEGYSNWREELEQLDENPLVGLGVRAGLAAGTALMGKMVYDKAKEVGEKIKERNKKTEDTINQLNQSYEPEGELVEYSNWREEIGLSEDWQKVNRQDKTDGLSQKAVDAYRRENPGSKLQTAVTEKKPKGKRAKRRASFCRRMKGMKSKLTSAKTARDPDSRINKALRRWNCN